MKGDSNIWWYFALAIGITWLFWVPGALQAQELLPFTFPEPLLFFGATGPIVAASILTWRESGAVGLRTLFTRLLHWRIPLRWYALGLLVPFAIHYVPVVIAGALGRIQPEFTVPGGSMVGAMPVMAISLAMYSLEEVGWRGYALPRLQERWSAVHASFILGLFATLWHLPLLGSPDYYVGPGPVWLKVAALWMFITAMTLVWTWFFNGTRGSLLLANWLHLWVNFSFVTLVLDVQRPWVYELLLPALSAGLLVVALVIRYGSDSLTTGRRIRYSQVMDLVRETSERSEVRIAEAPHKPAQQKP